jgi:hypothetical protein
MDINKAIKELENEKNIRFNRLMTITEIFFGKSKNQGSSNHPFKVPWQGEPRINLQKGKDGKAKPYQVKQVRLALIKLKEIQEEQSND